MTDDELDYNKKIQTQITFIKIYIAGYMLDISDH